MTVIAFIKTKDKIYLGSDSLASGSTDYLDFGSKVFKKPFYFETESLKMVPPHYFVIAFAGAIGVAEYLKYAFQMPEYDPLMSLEEYVTSSFLPSFRKALSDMGLLKTDSNGSQDSGLNFYIMYSNNIIEIQYNLTMFDSKMGFGAIGSGAIAAMGALDYSRKQTANPKARLKKCINTASRLTSSVGGKPVIYTITQEDYGDLEDE